MTIHNGALLSASQPRGCLDAAVRCAVSRALLPRQVAVAPQLSVAATRAVSRRHPVRSAAAVSPVVVAARTVAQPRPGIAWEDLPQEYGYGSGVTCWRRLRDWQQAGVWEALHMHLLTKLNAAGATDWSRAAVDGSHVRALLGGS